MGNKPIVHAPIATGSTEPRDIRDRFADWCNVKDFGAVGDGVVDDTTAFQAAGATGRLVFVPEGTYNLSEAIIGTFCYIDPINLTGTINLDISKLAIKKDLAPIGSIFYYASATVPVKYLVCNGQAVSRTTYLDLFTVCGTTYGTGDGSTTFNVPNLINKFPQGNATPGTVKAAGLPNITGRIDCLISWDGYSCVRKATAQATNAFYDGSDTYQKHNAQSAGLSQYKRNRDLFFDASKYNSIYGNSNTVQPPALTLLPIIKAL